MDSLWWLQVTVFKAFGRIILRLIGGIMNHSPNAVWRKVEKRRWNQCWPWTGYTSSGRGRIDIAGVQGVYAHRAAYLATHPGSIPLRDDGSKEQHVLHRCDNPLCCNPRHLFVGSHSDNIADK